MDNFTAKAAIVLLYSKGVTEMERGLAIELNPNSREYEKSVEIRETMKKNLHMVRERISNLQSHQPTNKPTNATPQHTCRLKRGSTFTCGPTSAPATGNFRSPVTSGARANLPANQTSKVPTKPRPTTSRGSVPVSRNGPSALPKSRSTPVNLSNKHPTAKDLKIPNVDPSLVQSILDEVVEGNRQKQNPTVFGDVAGNEEAKRALQENVIIPQRRPDIFNGLRSPVKGCLLYGPPGNGKTLLVRALANEANFTFLNVSASTITSKWFGEGEKLVRALFAVARALQPTIIFLDEIDSVLRVRSNNEHEASRKIKNTFFVEMDGINTDPNEKVILVAATNLPNQLDPAILRRFPLKIYVRLPDLKTRMELLEKLLAKANNPLTRTEMKEVAELTQGFSASDIATLTRDASLGPTREYTMEQLSYIDKKQIRKIQVKDFLASLKRVRPSIAPNLLAEFELMARNYST